MCPYMYSVGGECA